LSGVKVNESLGTAALHVPFHGGGGDDGMITDRGELGESSTLVPLWPLKIFMNCPRTETEFPW